MKINSRYSRIAALCATLITPSLAQAAYTVTLTESAGSVELTASGSLNTAGLTLNGTTPVFPSMVPSAGYIALGGSPNGVDRYYGVSGPTSFGSSGFLAMPGGSTGDLVGIAQSPSALLVPQGYVSGTSLSNSATFTGQTFSSLGLNPGTYTWTWGIGPTADSLLLQIGATIPPVAAQPVPTLSEWSMLMLIWLVGIAALGAIQRRG